MAYAEGLQYWAEKLNLPADPDFCPLARSVLELKERVKENDVFSKQDIIQGLGRINPGQWSQPIICGTGGMESNLAGVQETHGTTPSLFGSLPGSRNTTFPSPKPPRESWLTGQGASPIEAVTQTTSTTALVVELTSSIVPPDLTEEEKGYMLVVTASVRSLNLEMTGVILGDMVTNSAGGGAFENPCMAAILPGPI